MRSIRNGPTIRNRLQLPHPIKTDLRIAVICPPNSPAATAALEAGASLIGEDDLLALIKAGEARFDRLLCHADSAQKLNKAALGRILGPKGLMPSAKTGTMVRDVKKAIQGMVGSNEYREKQGVVRMGIGQLGFTPAQLRDNIQRFMNSIKSDMTILSEKITKEIHEVVSTPSPPPHKKFTPQTNRHPHKKRSFHPPTAQASVSMANSKARVRCLSVISRFYEGYIDTM